MIKLTGPSSFQISTTEQVYPLATWDDGSTLYCKKIDLGFLTGGYQTVHAHNIANIDLSKLYEAKAISYNGVDTAFEVGYANPFYVFIQLADIVIASDGNQQDSYVYVHLIYGKTV